MRGPKFKEIIFKLTPEQTTAINVLKEYLSQNIINRVVVPLNINALEQGATGFTEIELLKSALPKSIETIFGVAVLKWNQSNSGIKTRIELTDKLFDVIFIKLNLSQQKVPIKLSAKMWFFHVYETTGKFITSFFWCENGVTCVKKTIEVIFPEIKKQHNSESNSNSILPIMPSQIDDDKNDFWSDILQEINIYDF